MAAGFFFPEKLFIPLLFIDMTFVEDIYSHQSLILGVFASPTDLFTTKSEIYIQVFLRGDVVGFWTS